MAMRQGFDATMIPGFTSAVIMNRQHLRAVRISGIAPNPAMITNGIGLLIAMLTATPKTA
jgi:hypothetical protein